VLATCVLPSHFPKSEEHKIKRYMVLQPNVFPCARVMTTGVVPSRPDRRTDETGDFVHIIESICMS
jgi:hypothetical protein